jgi:hypothetical protein
MVTNPHWRKILVALNYLVRADGRELIDYFRTHNTMLFDEDQLDAFLRSAELLEIDSLKNAKQYLEDEIARREK